MNARTLPILFIVAVLTGCEARIQHGLDEAQANELQTVLLEAGFDARKIPEGGKKPTWAIEVDEEQASAATRVLAELGLPRPKLEGFGGMKTGLVATPTQERTAHLNALSEEISGTLQSVAGVTMARVHLVVPQQARPGQTPGVAKASAFVRVRPGYGAKVKGMEDDLRRLVAGSVEGLSPDNVALVVNEVVSTVPAPVQGLSPTKRLRYLVIALGAGVTILAILLVFVGVRMRAAHSNPVQPQAPAAPARPVVNASNARKAA